MKNFDFNEYFIKSVGFKSDPDFDAENPFDGPDLNDEKAFKLVSSPSQGKLCIIHPKVLRWITVAKQKLKELTDLTRRESSAPPPATASVFAAPMGDFLAADSPSSGTTINERQIMESADQDLGGKVDNCLESLGLVPRLETSNQTSATPSSNSNLGKRGRRSLYRTQLENEDIPAIPDAIRNERLDHRMSIGEALDYWWGDEGSKRTPECYRERVNVIVTIRSLYEPPSSKQTNCRICWWCVRLQRQKLSVWSIFIDETPRRTCFKCRQRFLRRTGCQTSFQAFWIELPRIFDHCIGNDGLRRLIAYRLCSRYIASAYRIVDGQLVQITKKRGRRPLSASGASSSTFTQRGEGEISDFSQTKRRLLDADQIKPEILNISEEVGTINDDIVDDQYVILDTASSKRKNPALNYVPEMCKNLMIDDHQTLEGAVDFWWSQKSAGLEERQAKRVEILRVVRSFFEGHERKPNGCCWWCGVVKQKNLDLQHSLAFVNETPRLACDACRKKCLDSALCITRIPDPGSSDPTHFVWWNLPPIYDNLTGRQAVKQLSIDKLLFTKKKPSTPSSFRKRLLPNNVKSTPNLHSNNQGQSSKRRSTGRCGNKIYDASVPEVFSNLDFDGLQTIGRAAEFWFNAARDSSSEETMIARGQIISKIRSLHRGDEVFGAAGGAKTHFCWWCGDTERLRWCRGVFSCEVSRYICSGCYYFNYRHVGCVTKVPVQQEDGEIIHVWWYLPRIIENADRSTIWNKLRQIGVVHDHVVLSKKRSTSLNPTASAAPTSDSYAKGCELDSSNEHPYS